MGTYYPPPVCPSPLTLVYFPWVRGDKDDGCRFEQVVALLPEGLAYGAFAVTPRGCEGGCEGWDIEGWLLDYVAAMDAAKELPCVAQGPLVTIGSSVGADGAVYACAQDERCVGALAVSPGGYLDIPFAEEVEAMVEQGKHVWSLSATGDTGATPRGWLPDYADPDSGIFLPRDEPLLAGREPGRGHRRPGVRVGVRTGGGSESPG